jgi:hypothetical protein|tara:strand:+ start:5310 stop:5579 length:270 start_codon:yes stop_codon:yes gene_type:complete
MLNNVTWGRNAGRINIEDLSTRELQRECSRALASGAIVATSANLTKYNKQAPHNSHLWYRAVIEDYVKQYGGLPSRAGPGVDVKLILEE